MLLFSETIFGKDIVTGQQFTPLSLYNIKVQEKKIASNNFLSAITWVFASFWNRKEKERRKKSSPLPIVVRVNPGLMLYIFAVKRKQNPHNIKYICFVWCPEEEYIVSFNIIEVWVLSFLSYIFVFTFICIQIFIVHAAGSESAISVGWNINAIDNTNPYSC